MIKNKIECFILLKWTGGDPDNVNMYELNVLETMEPSALNTFDLYNKLQKEGHLFFNLEMGETFIRRTDYVMTNVYPHLGNFVFHSSKPHPKAKTFIPIKGEIVRHFDAYNIHINIPHSLCPPLKVPNGFFKNDIKINYCGKPKENFYNINPLGGEGIDDQKLLQDLPLFWKNKTSIIEDHSNEHELQDLINARNINHQKLMTSNGANLEEKHIKIGYRK